MTYIPKYDIFVLMTNGEKENNMRKITAKELRPGNVFYTGDKKHEVESITLEETKVIILTKKQIVFSLANTDKVEIDRGLTPAEEGEAAGKEEYLQERAKREEIERLQMDARREDLEEEWRNIEAGMADEAAEILARFETHITTLQDLKDGRTTGNELTKYNPEVFQLTLDDTSEANNAAARLQIKHLELKRVQKQLDEVNDILG